MVGRQAIRSALAEKLLGNDRGFADALEVAGLTTATLVRNPRSSFVSPLVEPVRAADSLRI